MTFSARSRNPSSCRLSICSCLMLGWKVKSNCASVLTAGRREERIAACRRRLLRSAIWALRTSSIASLAVTAPLSTCASTPSTASRAPGIFKSASIARSRSRRSLAVAVIPPPPRRPATSGAPPRWCRARAGGSARQRAGRRDAGRDGLPRDAAPHARPARSGPLGARPDAAVQRHGLDPHGAGALTQPLGLCSRRAAGEGVRLIAWL